MASNGMSTLATFQTEYEAVGTKLDSFSAADRIKQYLLKLSLPKLKTFLGNTRDKTDCGKPNSKTRNKTVQEIMTKITTKINHHFEKEFHCHKALYFQVLCNGNTNPSKTECDQIMKNIIDALVPDITNDIFQAFLTGKAGPTEDDLLEYVQSSMEQIVSFEVRRFLSYIRLIDNSNNANKENTRKSPIGKLDLPEVLCKPLSLSSIPKFDMDTDSRLRSTGDLLIPILKPIMIPNTIHELRSVRVWRGINVRIMNYAIAVVTYGRYIDHPDFPSALKTITDSGPLFPPPHWVLIDFFKSSGLPWNISGKIEPPGEKRDHVYPLKEDLRKSILKDYKYLHRSVLSNFALEWDTQEEVSAEKKVTEVAPDEIAERTNTANESSAPKYTLKPMNCIVTSKTKRPPLFNNLQDWVFKYRHNYGIGCFDEFPFLNINPNNPVDVDYYKGLAEDGLHFKEVAIMETVLRSDIHNNRPPPNPNCPPSISKK